MKVFISWSGERSKAVALKLRDWLPDVIQEIEPWMSKHDIDAGARWGKEIAGELSNTKFGIICLTRDNFDAPWILFEAGALSKTVEDTYVCPYLIDLEPTDIPASPLTQFQAKRANEEETFDLIKTINSALKEKALPEERINRTFKNWWNELKDKIENLPRPESSVKPDRPIEDMMEEVLEIVRGLSRRDFTDRKLESENDLARAIIRSFRTSPKNRKVDIVPETKTTENSKSDNPLSKIKPEFNKGEK